MAGTRINPRIVTRQPHVDGDGATPQEIIAMMVDALEFTLLPERFSVGYADSLGFVRDDFAVFDLRSANVVRTPERVITPIDAIPVRLSEIGQRILRSQFIED